MNNKIIATIRKKVNEPSYFKNCESLNPNFLPRDLPFRHRVFGTLSNVFKNMVTDANFSLNCLMLGNPGSGKTSSAKIFGKKIKIIAEERIPKLLIISNSITLGG